MHYRRLGSSDLQVSVIGFGASPLGQVFGAVTPTEAEAAVHCAIHRGINLFDVSPYYGETLAEQRLGQALRGHRGKVVLSTKCGRYGRENFDFSARTITAQFEQSLLRLGTDHVDVLSAHDIEFAPPDQVLNETLPAMRVLQQQGKARYLGLTGYWPGQLAELAEAAGVQVVLNYCHSNLLMDDMDQQLTPTARRLDIGLLNASPLHMGLLGGELVPEWHPAPTEVRQACADVVSLCQAYGVDPAALALHTCLAHPIVASTLIGIKSSAQVETALEALDLVVPPGLLRAIQQKLAPVHNVTWQSGIPSAAAMNAV